MTRSLFIAAMTFALAAASASATPVLSDNFDSENGGATALGYTGFANFNVTSGNVDLVHAPDYGITCFGGAGSCVDLAGNTAGTITSKTAFNLIAADTLTLTFQVSGNQRTGASNMLDYGFSGASLVTNNATVAGNGPFTSYTVTLTGVTGAYNVFIGTADLTNIGPVLDNVVVTFTPGTVSTPEPAALALFGLVGAALGFVRRRR